MRRWKQLAVSLILTIAVLGAGFLLLPDSNRVYWLQHLPQHINAAADQGSVDDQSLVAWLDRLTQPQTYEVPGLESGKRRQIVWEPGWALDPGWVQITGYVLGGILGLAVMYAVVRSHGKLNQGGFYLWVLYILVIFPHMERYNHALLLPAMIWLWQRGQYKLVIVVYLLTGLSRLNHLWVTLLPSPWAPLASGVGLFAVLTLMGGIFIEFRSHIEVKGGS
jgi:alpha-1,2-mannosyltransferase